MARGSENLLPAIRQALKDRCSLGEVCGAMQDVFGKYAPIVLSSSGPLGGAACRALGERLGCGRPAACR